MGFLSKLFKRIVKSEIVDNTGETIIQDNSKSNSIKISGDNPIALPEEDTIGRNRFAQSFAFSVAVFRLSIFRTWGSNDKP